VCFSNLDAPKIKEREIEWCDVYGKSNYIPDQAPPQFTDKVFTTGPAVPVRLTGAFRAATLSLRTFAQCLPDRRRIRSAREHFANWRRQYRYRLFEAGYEPEPCSPDYVFFSSTIWKEEPETNQFRANFMAACQALPGLKFQGGFMPRTQNDVPGFERFTVPQHYSHAQFVANTKRSVVAFNTPSVFGCNPWRTAEFTCMGKAIVSTPLHRPMPAPLVHGEHAHFVDGSVESLRQAIQKIRTDTAYREHLEKNARTYYLAHLQPRRMLERIIEFARARAHRTPDSQPLPSLAPPPADPSLSMGKTG